MVPDREVQTLAFSRERKHTLQCFNANDGHRLICVWGDRGCESEMESASAREPG